MAKSAACSRRDAPIRHRRTAALCKCGNTRLHARTQATRWHAWIRIASVLTAPARDQVTAAVESFLDVEIPFSMSPRADKSPLSAIMREAPHAALIPLVPGALQATNLIGQAQYIAALEMAAASGGVTLILVATYNMADLLLRHYYLTTSPSFETVNA